MRRTIVGIVLGLGLVLAVTAGGGFAQQPSTSAPKTDTDKTDAMAGMMEMARRMGNGDVMAGMTRMMEMMGGMGGGMKHGGDGDAMPQPQRGR